MITNPSSMLRFNWQQSTNSTMTSSDYKDTLKKINHQVPQVPTLFLLDTSASMSKSHDGKQRIEHLQEGLDHFKEEISNHFEASEGVSVSVVTFGGEASIEQDFTPFKEWNPPNLSTQGTTPMSEAIMKGIGKLEDYKDAIDDDKYDRKRAHVWLLTDGEPDREPGSKEWEKAKEAINDAVDGKHVMMFAGAVTEDSNKQRLKQLIEPADKAATAFKVDSGSFKEVFEIASNSVSAESEPGEEEGEPDAEEKISEAKSE